MDGLPRAPGYRDELLRGLHDASESRDIELLTTLCKAFLGLELDHFAHPSLRGKGKFVHFPIASPISDSVDIVTEYPSSGYSVRAAARRVSPNRCGANNRNRSTFHQRRLTRLPHRVHGIRMERSSSYCSSTSSTDSKSSEASRKAFTRRRAHRCRRRNKVRVVLRVASSNSRIRSRSPCRSQQCTTRPLASIPVPPVLVTSFGYKLQPKKVQLPHASREGAAIQKAYGARLRAHALHELD